MNHRTKSFFYFDCYTLSLVFLSHVFVVLSLRESLTKCFVSTLTCFPVLSYCLASARLYYHTQHSYPPSINPVFTSSIIFGISIIQDGFFVTKKNASTFELTILSTMGFRARTIQCRFTQLPLVQQTLQNGVTPTVIADFAMGIAQMQSQAAHPDVLLTYSDIQ